MCLIKCHIYISGKCTNAVLFDLSIVKLLNIQNRVSTLFWISTYNISLIEFLIVDFLFYTSMENLSILIFLLNCINLFIWNKLPSFIFDFNTSLLSHGHRIISVITKLILIYNGMKKWTKLLIIINCIYPYHRFHHSCRNISSLWWFYMEMVEYLLCSGTKCMYFQANDKKNHK